MNHKDRIKLTKHILHYFTPEGYEKHGQYRRNGSSTRMMWSILEIAYSNQGEWIPIIDHHECGDKTLADTIRHTMQSLSYSFEIKKIANKYCLMIPKLGPLTPEEAKEEGLL